MSTEAIVKKTNSTENVSIQNRLVLRAIKQLGKSTADNFRHSLLINILLVLTSFMKKRLPYGPQSSISYRYNKQTENQFPGKLYSASENLLCKVFESNAEREIKAMRQKIENITIRLYTRNPPEINVQLCRTCMYIFCILSSYLPCIIFYVAVFTTKIKFCIIIILFLKICKQANKIETTQ